MTEHQLKIAEWICIGMFALEGMTVVALLLIEQYREAKQEKENLKTQSSNTREQPCNEVPNSQHLYFSRL